MVALIALLLIAPSRRLGRRTQIGAVVLVGGLAAMLWPSTLAQFWNVPGKDIPVEVAFGFRGASGYEKASLPERDGLAAYNRVAPPGSLAATDAHERAWLTDGRDLSPSWEVRSRMLITGPLPTTPTGLYQRYRQVGVGWVILTSGTPIAGDPLVQAMVGRYGQLRYRDNFASVYQLSGRPAPPVPVADCDPTLAGRPGCWQGGLDATPGYTGQESPGGIARTVPVCPGEVLIASVRVAPGGGPVQTAVLFGGHDSLARTPAAQAQPGSVTQVGGPAPPGAHTATISIVAPAGTTVRRISIGHIGSCAGAR
jgi:hypothetical protein